MIEKSNRADLNIEKLNQMESEIKSLKNTINDQALTIRTLADEKRSSQEYLMISENKNSLIQKDKDQLLRDISRLEDKIDILEEKLTISLEKTREASEAKSAITDKIDDMKISEERDLRRRIEEEINKLSEKSHGDVEKITNQMRELHDREVQVLTDQRSRAEEKLSQVEARLDTRDRMFDEIQQENQRIKSQLHGELVELQATLRLKTFESERLGAASEETNHLFKEIRLENEMLKSKVEVLKEEYKEIENRMKTSSVEEKSELMMLRQKLAERGGVEKNLNACVAAILNGEDESDSFTEDTNLIKNILKSEISQDMSSRADDLIRLTKSLKNKNNEINQLKIQKSKIEEILDETAEKLQISDKIIFDQVKNDPKKILMLDTLRYREKENLEKNNIILQLDVDIKKLKNQIENVINDKRGIENNLEEVLKGYEDLQNIANDLYTNEKAANEIINSHKNQRSNSQPLKQLSNDQYHKTVTQQFHSQKDIRFNPTIFTPEGGKKWGTPTNVRQQQWVRYEA
eukprot:GHVL01014340.1.p1 GENE.GHVL01014340.1~~GHVL01014340.1.p1  ORF type:complete len:520 (+),score=160.72 GHVL01014340.1:445-2004(+)